MVFPEPFGLGAFHGDGQVTHLAHGVVGQLKIFHIEPEIADVTKQPGQCAWLVRDFHGDHGKFLRFLPVFSTQGHGTVLPES